MTAGELRRLGAEISEEIPDCAWVPLRSLDLRGNWDGGDALHLEISYRKPFRWVRAEVGLKGD